MTPAAAKDPALSVRLPRFAVISGLGWLLDVSVLLSLVTLGTDVLVANMIGAWLAVSFVFVAAQRAVFLRARAGVARLYLSYLVWHAVMILAASVAIDQAAAVIAACGPLPEGTPGCALAANPTVAAGLAKIVVTPVTLYANYVFMGWLLEARVSWL